MKKIHLLCAGLFVISSVHAQKWPSLVFCTGYLFEATENGDGIQFPLLPGETAVATLNTVISTAEGYADKLREIYAFNHFTLLTTLGTTYSVGLDKNDGGVWIHTQLGKDPAVLLSLYIQSPSAPRGEHLPMRIGLELDTLKSNEMPRKAPHKLDDSLFLRTLATVKSGHPIVLGRSVSDAKKSLGIFLVLVPKIVTLDDRVVYSDLLNVFQNFLDSIPGSNPIPIESEFNAVNDYYVKLKNIKPLKYYEWQKESENPQGQDAEDSDVPIFVPMDEAPSPIGGMLAIQFNVKYPEKAVKDQIEGTVLVNALIGKDGKVKRTLIVKSLREDVDKAAQEAVLAISWQPAKDKGKPVGVWIVVPIIFKLK